MKWNIIENNLINASFITLIIALITSWINLIIIKIKYLNNLTYILTLSANICLSISLATRWINNSYFPLSNLYESLIFLTWCLTLIEIILENKNYSTLLTAIISPVALLTISFASISLPQNLRNASPLVPALQSNWLMMHVTVMMISYGTLIIGSLLSILFLIISTGKDVKIQGNSYNNYKKLLLKYNSIYYGNEANTISNNIENNKSIYKFNRINLLESIDNLSYRIIGFGFPLLTIGIIAGAVWANEAWGSYWNWDPKETWALITWLIFAIYLHSRLNQAWKGKKPAILASIGFIIVWICYLGVNFLGQGLHNYGWIS